MQHHEVQATELHLLATLGHMAHFMGDEAADGVERLFSVAALQRDLEGLGHALDGRVAADAVGAVGQGEDVARIFGNVELVLDLADDLFEHVLDGDEPCHAAELVDHDGQVVAVAAELAQQVVEALALGHEHGRAQQRADVQLGRPLQLEQVLGHQDADDVLALAVVHRKARMCRVDDQVQKIIERRVDVDEVHAGRGHHHFARRHVRHADHTLEHDPRLGANDVVVLGLGQRFDQLFGRVRSGVDELGDFLQEGALVFLFGQSPGVRVRHCLGVQDVR